MLNMMSGMCGIDKMKSAAVMRAAAVMLASAVMRCFRRYARAFDPRSGKSPLQG
jgi:hypothetical protein